MDPLSKGSVVGTVVFDWDGTAVPDRSADAVEVRDRVERLCGLGADVVVVTGTSVGNVDGQLRARPPGPGGLFICANCGSEVFEVGAEGPSSIWRRTATEQEEAALSAAAERLRDGLGRRGVDARIVYDRLNRKVDLIPEWPDPPRSASLELLARVERRLSDAGLGGLAEVLDLARKAVVEADLAEPRITSDVKHVEIGLTDKRDAIGWVAKHVLDEDGPEAVLVLGDEFGPVGSVEGSDLRMIDRSIRRAVFVSVGAEPGGVPEPVRWVGGGPAGFLDVLDNVLAELSSFSAPVEDPSWRIEVEGFDPLREREFESWFAVANGLTGTRGSLEEGSEQSDPATYLAGFFARAGAAPMGPELAVGPEWTRLDPRSGRRSLGPGLEQLEDRRILDLRQGILFRSWTRRLPGGAEVTLRSARFASLAERRMLVMQARAGSSNATITLDGRRPPPPGAGPYDEVAVRRRGGRAIVAARARRGASAAFAMSTTQEAEAGCRRLVAVAGPCQGEMPAREAEELLARAEAQGVAGIRAQHRAAWRARWRDADVIIEGDPGSQRAMRFALYHLISAGDPGSDAASIGARGLTGPGYLGHVFWDTDVFMAPFFIWTHPATARALLTYRHRTLPGARAKAAGLGYRGALYAWESADTGEEVTPTEAQMPDGRVVPILTGLQEHHISADVAWAVWRYWQATGDLDFLMEMGAEIVLETARFWASRARRGPDGRHHIASVIGPDEYHEGVRDNAFTNVMARWNIERGLEVADLIRERDPRAWRELAGRLGLRPRELDRGRAVAANLVDGFDPDTLLFEQFAGSFGLEDLQAVDLAPRPFPADLVLGRRRLRRSQVAKQADVVMLAHMLPDVLAPRVAASNYRYYEPRTSHGSSLSPAVHAAVGARVGELDDALSYFRMAGGIDLDDRMGNASAGVHMATMGGLWQAAVMGFGGLRVDAAGVRIDPRLPRPWDRLAFPVRWRGTRLRVGAGRDRLLLVLDGPAAVAVGAGAHRRLGPGTYLSRRSGGRWLLPREVHRS